MGSGVDELLGHWGAEECPISTANIAPSPSSHTRYKCDISLTLFKNQSSAESPSSSKHTAPKKC